MKTIPAFLCSWFVFFKLANVAPAQSLGIDWFTIEGGGGSSSGGGFAISGSTGQPDATGALTGGNFSLTGGFWSGVETAGTPRLTIYLASLNRVVVSWPSPSTGFLLEQTAAPARSSWLTPPETIMDDGTNKFIIVHPATGNRFFRLVRP